MAKSVNNTVLDAALDEIATSIEMTLCNAEPTTLAEAQTTFALADVVMAGGDFTNADGDSSGRKVTVSEKATITVDTTGTGTHVALNDGSILIYVTTCTSQAVTSGNTITFPAWDIEIADPT